MSFILGGADGLIPRAAAAQAGFSDGQLHRLTSRDELRRIRHGVYASTVGYVARSPEARHLMSVQAAVASQRSTTIVSHQSAAVLLDLPIWDIDLRTVHVIQTRRNAGRRTLDLHVHPAAADSVPTVMVGELLVTSPARTLFDVAAGVAFESAVVMVDAALHRDLVTPQELVDELLANRGRRGRQRAAAVFAFADGRSESPGESRSRVGMHRAGLPTPGLQYEVLRADGSVAGRSDFDWKEVRLLGEFDGMSKYGGLLRPGETVQQAVVREKLREDELRDLDYGMVRWTWPDLSRPGVLYPRIQAAHDRERRRNRS